jgi:hypothetical protein
MPGGVGGVTGAIPSPRPDVCPAWAQSKWGSSPLYENQNHENGKPNTSRGQGEAGDRLSERRLCETRVPMNKNLIKGRRDGVSWHNTAKPTGEVVEVNQAIVRGRTAFLPGEVSGVRAPEKSAEVIVVGKRAGVRMHSKIAGGLSR